MNARPQTTHLQLGTARKPKSRGVYRPSPQALEEARGKYATAEAAVRVAIVGREMSAAVEGKNILDEMTRRLVVYIAHVQLGVPKKVLATLLASSPRRVRYHCEFVEAWRGAPLIDRLLAEAENALPRST